MSPHDCEDYRFSVLREYGVTGVEERHRGCDACRTWEERFRREVGVLSSLDRQVAPDELDQRVQARLTGIEHRLEWLGDALPRHAAPEELDAMVAERLMDDSLETVEVEEPEALVGLLRGLGSAPAPQVLDRLVAEEIEAGPRAGVVRAVRELERQSAPSRLNAAPLAARTAKHRGKLALVAAALLVFVLGASNGWFQSDDRQPVFVPIDTLAFVSEDDESLTGFEARLQATSERPTRGSIKLTRLGRSLSMDAAPTTYLVALQGGTGMRVDSEQPLAPAQPLESLRKDSSSNVDQVEEEVQR